MIDIEKLKQKILDLAIRGKLVPQDPNDEPASVLIEKIRAEKAKLVKEGKIKASKEDSYIYKGSDNSYYEKEIKIGDAIGYIQPLNYIVKSTNYDDKYETPVLTPGKAFILGYTNETKGIYDATKDNVIIFDDFTTATKFVDFKFKVKSSAMKILISKASQEYNIKYFYYLLKTIHINSDTHKRFWISEYEDYSVFIPPNWYQNLVVDFLDVLFCKIDWIYIENRKLVETIESVRTKILDYFFNENSSYKSYYPSCAIKDVCYLNNGEVTNNGTLPYLEAKVIRGSKEPKMLSSGVYIKKGTKVILVDGENSGEIMVAPYDGYMGSTFKIFSINSNVIEEDYLTYFVIYKKEELRNTKTGSAIPHLNKKLFYQFDILLPPKEKQKYFMNKINLIFNILDKIA